MDNKELIILAVIASVGFVVSTVIHTAGMGFQDSLDDCKTIRRILKRMGIEPDHVHEHWTGAKRDIYGVGWGLLWLPIYLIGLVFWLYDMTGQPIFDIMNERAEKKKKYITLQEIYSFQKGDTILMKDGSKKSLLTFTADSFSDSTEEIFPWIDAKENVTATARNDKKRKSEKFEIFDREAKAFEKRVKEFNKAMDEAKKEVTA